ncbi:MAG: CPBP family intramembrane metalloprotease [Chloroflexi bacterium]|nr:CPBP family intramembrane metalloprotease [Chloroflexota bacterium]
MTLVEVTEPAAPEQRPAPWLAIGLGAAVLVVVLIVLGLVGELAPFLSQGANVLPFVALAVLAALGERHGWARWLAYLYLALVLNAGLLLVSFGMVVLGSLGGRLPVIGDVPPAEVLTLLRPAFLFLLVGLLLYGLSLVVLLPAVRRALARVLPLRPESTMNAAGLSAAVALATLPLAALIALGGQPPLLTLISLPGAGEIAVRPLDQIYFLVWLLPAALVLVGWPLLRAVPSALTRLGLVRPTLVQVGIGIGAGIALVLLVQVLEPALTGLWQALGLPQTDSNAFSKLMAGLITPIGAIVIAITAGLGEELAVRGVLQPRLGLVLANLAFTAAHAFQYSWDGLLIVFVIGLALGLLRLRTNTTTCAIAHGVYDFILVMLAVITAGAS